MVEGVRLILNDGDMSLHVRRTDPAEGYENDFIADYFLKPFQAFLHEHDHDMCQAIHESQAAQAASEAPPRQPSIYDGVPVKITNKRKIA